MSSLRYCDCEDCSVTEDDTTVYSINADTEKFLKRHFRSCFNAFEDICKDCVDILNEDYPDMLLDDGSCNLYVNQKYLDNDELLGG